MMVVRSKKAEKVDELLRHRGPRRVTDLISLPPSIFRSSEGSTLSTVMSTPQFPPESLAADPTAPPTVASIGEALAGTTLTDSCVNCYSLTASVDLTVSGRQKTRRQQPQKSSPPTASRRRS